MSLPDPVESGLNSGWKVYDLSSDEAPALLEADVAIIGTGAGGATAAEILTAAGLSVVLIEEGGLYHQKHFKMNELWSYGHLYQEAMSRTTVDAAISIMQGKSVGGSTTVNWTSSFRTPEETLAHWSTEFGVQGATRSDMDPWFADREKRLSISPWEVEPNPNNAVLQKGGKALGWDIKAIPRNVKGCWNLGYCGFGCPTNAKQSMLVTSIPDAMNLGAKLLTRASVERLVFKDQRVQEIHCQAVDAANRMLSSHQAVIRARHVVLAAGAIGSPGILLRSKAPDPEGITGHRTFLHPVVASIAEMDGPIEPYYGAPQSIYSDEFTWRDGAAGKMGFKLEVPPLHPALAAGVLGMHGESLKSNMSRLANMNAVLALLRDGFHPDSPGGQVVLRKNDRPGLDYKLTDYLWEGVREAYQQMVKCQFAAGAKSVRLLHLDSPVWSDPGQATADIAAMTMAAHRVRLFSAHVMGGCTMGEDTRTALVNSYGRHHHVENLSVMDGSVFPTSIGANPQLSIYGLTARNATHLARDLTGL